MLITTERFYLRPLSPTDATPRYAGWFKDPEVKKHITHRVEEHDLGRLQAYITEKNNQSNVLFLAIFTKKGEEHIGNLKYEPIDDVNKYAILGIMIGEPHWRGQGVAAEVLQASGKWLRREKDIRRILLCVSLDHAGAIRAYEKAGFRASLSNDIPHDPKNSQVMEWIVAE